jgi:hypothetical protein
VTKALLHEITVLTNVDVAILMLNLDVFVFTKMTIKEATKDYETVGKFYEAVTIK